MVTQQIQEISRDISSLKQELGSLRSLLVGKTLKDKEGKYTSQFVNDVIKASQKKPDLSFKGKKRFLNEIKNS